MLALLFGFLARIPKDRAEEERFRVFDICPRSLNFNRSDLCVAVMRSDVVLSVLQVDDGLHQYMYLATMKLLLVYTLLLFLSSAVAFAPAARYHRPPAPVALEMAANHEQEEVSRRSMFGTSAAALLMVGPLVFLQEASAVTIKEMDMSMPSSYDELKSSKASAENVQSLTVDPKSKKAGGSGFVSSSDQKKKSGSKGDDKQEKKSKTDSMGYTF